MEGFYADDFIQFLQNHKGLSNSTGVSYRRDLEAFMTYLEERHILTPKEVQESDLTLYALKMKRGGKSPATVSRSVATLRNYFGFLQQNGYLSINPAYRLSPPKVERKQTELLSFSEIESLLKAPDRSTLKGARDATMLELFYGAGLKVTELLALNQSDVRLDHGYIRCKGSSQSHSNHRVSEDRFIPLGKHSAEALQNYLAYLGQMGQKKQTSDSDPNLIKTGGEEGKNSLQQPLFTNSANQRLTRQGVWKIIKTNCQLANIDKSVTPHQLRHAFAVHLLQHGADVRTVQELLGLGEQSGSHMNHYVDQAQKSIKSVMDRMHP